jgi:peptidoglycan hydrolase CwlO-like protein
MSEPCIYKEQINKLVDSVPRLEVQITTLTGSVAAHTKIISDFIAFQAEHNGESKGEKEIEARLLIAKELEATQKRDKTSRRFLYVMAVIGVIGLLLTAYFSFKSSKAPEQIQQTEQNIKQRIDLQEGISKVTRGGYVKYNDQGLSDSIKIK